MNINKKHILAIIIVMIWGYSIYVSYKMGGSFARSDQAEFDFKYYDPGLAEMIRQTAGMSGI